MPARPNNHVTDAAHQAQLAAPAGTGWPEVPEDLLVYLEDLYPPECFRGGTPEALHEHLRYGGAQGLVAALRVAFEAQRDAAIEPDDEADSVTIERED